MFAQDTFNFSFDTDVVVVGRVSMNKKKAKKNLQKIATKVVEPMKEVKTVAKTVAKTVTKATPVVKETKVAVKEIKVTPVVKETKVVKAVVAKPAVVKAVVAKSVVEFSTPSSKCWADMESDDDDDFVFTVEKAEEMKLEKSKKRTHRGGRSRDKRDAQALRKAQLVETHSTLFSLLPENLLAELFSFNELQVVGVVAVCNRSTRATMWDNALFWNHLGGPSARAACSVAPLMHVPARDGFRLWLFGLQGDWASAFTTFASTAPVTEVLSEASYLAGGLLMREKESVDELVHAVAGAAARAEEDFEQAELHLASFLRKAQKRTEIFSECALIELSEAKEAIQERSLLARLEVEDDVADFNPFGDDVADVVVEELEEEEDWTQRPRALEDSDTEWMSEHKDEDETLDLDFAQSFMNLLA